ncbi:MORN repeat/PH domain containing protein [Lotmaria passim]
MLGEPHVLLSEEQAPLLSTAKLVTPEENIALDDGLYDTPQMLSRDVTYTGHVADHKLCGDGCLRCERGIYTGTFYRNALTGQGNFSVNGDAVTPRSNHNTMAPSDPRRSSLRSGGTTTSAFLIALTEEGLDSAMIVSYEGEWRDGVPQGRGVMRWENGDVYEGLFERGQPHGSGNSDNVNTFTFADGRVYTGDFESGRRDGKGKILHINGDVYDGQFVRGTVTGFGTIIYAKGPRIYRGLFEHGRKVKGYLRFPGSQRGYDGEWQDDVPHGSGSMTFANGDFYKGDFAAGELNGVGCLCYQKPVGKIYYGQFLRGQPCGRGFLYEPENRRPSANSNTTNDDEDSQTEPKEARITECYFQNGQAVGEGETEAKEAVIEATRGLRAPEATAPPYTTLLQLRPASSAAALTTSFAGYNFSIASPRGEMSFGTSPNIGAAGPAIPLVPTKDGSFATGQHSPGTTGAGDVSSSPPPANSLGNSFGRTAPSNASSPPPPSDSGNSARQGVGTDTGGGAGTTEEDEEQIVSVGSDDVDVDELEADNAVLVNANRNGSPNNASSSVMPVLSCSAEQDGSCRGWLEKCAIGRRNLSLISNWKRRYFILALCNDSVCLGYYEDDQCRKPIGFIRLNTTDTRIVTCPTTKTHKKANKPGRDLCVIYHENRKEFKLLLRARDVKDHDRWAAAFRSFFLIVDRPSDYPMHAFQS